MIGRPDLSSEVDARFELRIGDEALRPDRHVPFNDDVLKFGREADPCAVADACRTADHGEIADQAIASDFDWANKVRAATDPRPRSHGDWTTRGIQDGAVVDDGQRIEG
jgi:hypothetical protein